MHDTCYTNRHMKWLLLLSGGAAGSLVRYSISIASLNLWGQSFPYGTLIANCMGCLLIGFLIPYLDLRQWLTQEMSLFLIVGFCGALTTFSTLILQTSDLLKSGFVLRALMNLIISVILGFTLFYIGHLLGTRIHS